MSDIRTNVKDDRGAGVNKQKRQILYNQGGYYELKCTYWLMSVRVFCVAHYW